MLNVGLTGGIAAGKSLVSARLRELGAVLIDADALAREVVQPGSAGLNQVAEAFGANILDEHGALDRPALGRIIFSDPRRREELNSIIHPLVRARAMAMRESAAPEAVVVQDIPLLVETGQAADFHLVVVVEAELQQRIDRLVRFRGMVEGDARARIMAQASPAERAACADVLIDNSGSADATQRAVDSLWEKRIVPFNQNLLRRVPAQGPSPEHCQQQRKGTSPVERLVARLHRAFPEARAVDDLTGHESQAGPGIVVEITVDSTVPADRLDERLSQAGFPPVADSEGRYAAADPCVEANVLVRY